MCSVPQHLVQGIRCVPDSLRQPPRTAATTPGCRAGAGGGERGAPGAGRPNSSDRIGLRPIGAPSRCQIAKRLTLQQRIELARTIECQQPVAVAEMPTIEEYLRNRSSSS